MSRCLVLLLVCCAHLFLVNSAHAGIFVEAATPNHYTYSGDIEDGDVVSLALMARGSTIVIDSGGGSYQAGLQLGHLTRAMRMHIIVAHAGSAAALWAIGDRKFTYLNDTSALLFHIPFIENWTDTPELWMLEGIKLQEYMEWGLGCSRARAKWFMSEMHQLRKAFSIHGYVAMRRHQIGYMIGDPRTRTYHWYATRSDYNTVNHPYPVE